MEVGQPERVRAPGAVWARVLLTQTARQHRLSQPGLDPQGWPDEHGTRPWVAYSGAGVPDNK